MSTELSKEKVKDIFSQALKSVADGFNPDGDAFPGFTFSNFHQFHKVVFLNQLKSLFLKERFTYEETEFCHDVALNENMFDDWKNFDACINYLYTKQQNLRVEAKILKF